MSRWYEIRNAPERDGGDVIAIWYCSNDDYELSFGVKDRKCVPDNEDDVRTFARDDVSVIDATLVHEISEADFSVLSEIADIPLVISDGQLHFLGVLHWRHVVNVLDSVHDIQCSGEVYTKVVWSSDKWYKHSPTVQFST